MSTVFKKLLPACFVMLTACGGGSGGGAGKASPASAGVSIVSGGLVINYVGTPDPPVSGDNSIVVTLKGSDGKAVDDAEVSLVYSMPPMPSMNMPAMRSELKLVPQGAGRYAGIGQLSMTGTWIVSLSVVRNGQTAAESQFSVIVP